METLFPAPLKPGDTIAIVSPASTVKPEYVERAVQLLRSAGYNVKTMPSALGPADGSYAAPSEARVADLRAALLDDNVKCILCARGGYGCVHLLTALDPHEIQSHPKWLVGFSDVSALHALWHKAGVASIHGPMAKHLASHGAEDPATSALLAILESGAEAMQYDAAGHPFNRPGMASGKLLGGNLAVLNGLAATPYDIFPGDSGGEGIILFIEDISEAIYAVERMLSRLHLAGVFGRLRGLVVGQFTEYRPDRNFPSMEAMIDTFLRERGIENIPVAFNFPVGHVDRNLPLVEGAPVTLTVTEDTVSLKYK